MAIKIEEKNGDILFHLQTKSSSYIMGVKYEKYLTHIYWGKKISGLCVENALPMRWSCFDVMEPVPEDGAMPFSMDYVRQEFPVEQSGDYREPALKAEFSDGSRCLSLVYDSYELIEGKPQLKGLPAVYTENDREAQTLLIRMKDTVSGLLAELSYSVMEEFDAMTRSVRLVNTGKDDIRCNQISSLSVDFEDSEFDMLCLPGAWGRERHIDRRALHSGSQIIGSNRGASSHQMNPFFAMARKGASEQCGEVYGMNLVYSGNYHGGVEVDQIGGSRAYLGIGDADFSWLLKAGEEFQTPEVVMVYSAEGLGGMSRTYHRLYRKRLVRGEYRDKIRPILANNWEGTYFDFTEDKIVDIAKKAGELGIELMVLDDGWFGKRNDDTSSLGDWFVNKDKIPSGLSGLASRINDAGLLFGLWLEPEMVSVDSELYRSHSDWCIHVESRERKECRNQLVLDLSRDDVCDYLIKTIDEILSSANIAYIKWDMNRHMSNLGSSLLSTERQRELPHRYMLGLYRVLETITQKHKNVLFESCSGGGGRFDAGMLYYMPQTWTSDDTDAVERLYIQYGTSIVYPTSAMGAHVSAVPNHQSGRMTSLKMRGDVAMSGNFGYELDLTKFTEEEQKEVKEQVAQYKKLRQFIQSADMYRLASPFEGNTAAWQFISEDKKQIFAAFFRIMAQVNVRPYRMKFQGLQADALYEDAETGQRYYGDELMQIGLLVDMHGDYQSKTWQLNKC